MRKRIKSDNPFKFFDRPTVTETDRAPTNLQKAVRGETAILGHLRYSGYDACLEELLCSLMHWARFSGFDFDATLKDAKAQYEGEFE